MNKILLLTYLLLLSLGVKAQNYKVEGRIIEIVDGKNMPVEAASVSLLTTDSALVKGNITDQKGLFEISQIPSGDYILSISFIGYETTMLSISNLERSTNLGDIILNENSIALENVTVTASNIIQKVDRQIILPRKSSVDKSSDAYDLLNNMKIPRLYVNPIMKTLEISSGGGIQTRVNGVKVSPIEIAAIRAKDVLRVEYIEDPGSRYGEKDLGAVINIITRRREAGGYVALQGIDSPHTLFGENMLAAKYNNK